MAQTTSRKKGPPLLTDLMQGPVYGVFTDECSDEERLLPFFNYDELFGTVLNRFVVQAVADYPLTIYGKGSQIRGYLNIKDTFNCVRLSLENPANEGELRIFNQFVETFSVIELAERVQQVAQGLGFSTEVKPIENPRVEAEEHYYNPAHTGLLELGLEPHYLTDDVLGEMMTLVMKYKDRINRDAIFRGVKWKEEYAAHSIEQA